MIIIAILFLPVVAVTLLLLITLLLVVTLTLVVVIRFMAIRKFLSTSQCTSRKSKSDNLTMSCPTSGWTSGERARRLSSNSATAVARPAEGWPTSYRKSHTLMQKLDKATYKCQVFAFERHLGSPVGIACLCVLLPHPFKVRL